MIAGGEDLKNSIFRCLNRYGDIAEYNKIVEFSSSSKPYWIVVLETDQKETFWKYNPEEQVPHLYELKEDERRIAIDKYEMLKNLAIASLACQENESGD